MKSKSRQVKTARTEIIVSLPSRLALAVDLYFFDLNTGKPIYGARSKLIAELLEEWLTSTRKGTDNTMKEF